MNIFEERSARNQIVNCVLSYFQHAAWNSTKPNTNAYERATIPSKRQEYEVVEFNKDKENLQKGQFFNIKMWHPAFLN